MNYLLDTHTFLWWVLDDPQLSPAARIAVSDEGAQVFVSVVSAWEIVIKHQAGKLAVDPVRLFPEQLDTNGFQPLAITLAHIERLATLPLLHKDPFDRLLVAQAACESLQLITSDRLVRQYAVPTLW